MEPNAHKVAHRIILSVVGLTLQSPNGDTMISNEERRFYAGIVSN